MTEAKTVAKNTIMLISDDINCQEQVLQSILLSDLGVSDLAVSIQVLEQVTQAWDYLTGTKRYSDRERYPMPALILIDIEISGLSALDFLGWIKQNHKFKDIPVVTMGSASDVKKLGRAYYLDEKPYFVKGRHFEVLIHLVKTLLGSMSEKHPNSVPSHYLWRSKRQYKVRSGVSA